MHHLLLIPIFLLQSTLFAQAGQKLIKSIYFGGGSYYIDGVQAEEIQDFIRSIPNIEHYQIIVSSHTDNIGGAEYNKWLSSERSDSVIDELKAINISEDKVLVQDNGQHNPFFDNTTNNGRVANRRVDIILSPLYF